MRQYILLIKHPWCNHLQYAFIQQEELFNDYTKDLWSVNFNMTGWYTQILHAHFTNIDCYNELLSAKVFLNFFKITSKFCRWACIHTDDMFTCEYQKQVLYKINKWTNSCWWRMMSVFKMIYYFNFNRLHHKTDISS